MKKYLLLSTAAHFIYIFFLLKNYFFNLRLGSTMPQQSPTLPQQSPRVSLSFFQLKFKSLSPERNLIFLRLKLNFGLCLSARFVGLVATPGILSMLQAAIIVVANSSVFHCFRDLELTRKINQNISRFSSTGVCS